MLTVKVPKLCQNGCGREATHVLWITRPIFVCEDCTDSVRNAEERAQKGSPWLFLLFTTIAGFRTLLPSDVTICAGKMEEPDWTVLLRLLWQTELAKRMYQEETPQEQDPIKARLKLLGYTT